MAAAEKMQTKRSEPEKRAPEATAPLIAPTVRSKLTMTTKRRTVRFPIRSRTTLGAPFGQHPALSTRRRQPLLAQKRSSNKPRLSCALTGGEYRQAAGAIAAIQFLTRDHVRHRGVRDPRVVCLVSNQRGDGYDDGNKGGK